jgi:SPP1 family predicted phage head-tail adaptor
MPAGDLRKRIAIRTPTHAEDGMGGYTTTYTTRATVWAAIWPVSAKEQIQAMGQSMEISHRVRIRYLKTFSPEWKLRRGSRDFNVVSIINPQERNQWLDLMVKEVI